MSETSITPQDPHSVGPVEDGQQSSRPFYKRPVFIVLSIAAIAALVAGGLLISVLNNHPTDHPAAATSSTPIVSITSPTSSASAKPSTSAKPSSKAKPKPTASKPTTGGNSATNGAGGSAGDTSGSGSAPVAGGAPITGSNGGVGTGSTGGGGTGITPQNPAPAPAPVKPAPAPVKPRPIIVPPPVVEQPPAPPVRENPYQSLGSINAHRIANGVPGFIAPSPACRPIATVTGTALDSYQHQNVVLAVYGKTAAAFSKGADYDTLTVYQC